MAKKFGMSLAHKSNKTFKKSVVSELIALRTEVDKMKLLLNNIEDLIQEKEVEINNVENSLTLERIG